MPKKGTFIFFVAPSPGALDPASAKKMNVPFFAAHSGPRA
jgi:hypothetical protein